MGRTKYNRPDYKDGVGGFDPSYHYEMVSDQERVGQIKKALACTLTPDMTFCELGCGTGIFSLHAAKTVKKVYAVEYDKATAEFAKKNFGKSPFKDKIELIEANALEVVLPEKVDVIFAEMLSTALIHEPQVPVINHMRQFLKPNGFIIPYRIVNIAELVNVDFVFDDVEIRTCFYEFTGIKKPRLMSLSHNYFTADFVKKVPMEVKHTYKTAALIDGIINAVRLTSIVCLAEGVNFYSTDSLMPPVIIPLKNDVDANWGDTLKVKLNYKHMTDLNKVTAEVIPICSRNLFG